jgi:hypothetical protein
MYKQSLDGDRESGAHGPALKKTITNQHWLLSCLDVEVLADFKSKTLHDHLKFTVNQWGGDITDVLCSFNPSPEHGTQ